MKEIAMIFPKDKKLSNQIYKDFEEVYSLSKLQVNIFECITWNQHLIQEKARVITCCLEANCGGYITYPFMNEDGIMYINPYRCYTYLFDESDFIPLLDEIRENTSDEMSEEEVISFVENKINDLKNEVSKFIKKNGIRFTHDPEHIKYVDIEPIIKIFK